MSTTKIVMTQKAANLKNASISISRLSFVFTIFGVLEGGLLEAEGIHPKILQLKCSLKFTLVNIIGVPYAFKRNSSAW